MVRLPLFFTATKYPGYFWHTVEQQLYSMKIDGVLKPLKITKPNKWNLLRGPAYRVSVKGKRRNLYLDYLEKLTIEDSEIPLKDE